MILACHHISKSFLEHPVLTDVTFHIEKGEKAAIVGVNGAGKSTLLKIIIGQMEPDEGTVSFSRETTFGYLAQNQDVSSDNTIYEELLTVKQELVRMEQTIAEDEKRMGSVTGEALTDLMTNYTNLLHDFELRGGYSYKGEIAGILKGLGFAPEEFGQRVGTLSGGQKTRVALVKLLLQSPDLIILDEPTNHLDLGSIRWLETYLMNYRGAVLIVSHDRYFLDRVVTRVIELENTKAAVFTGNYTAYAARKEALRREQRRAWLNNQAEIKHQEEVIAKLRSFNREKSIKRAESREKMLQKMTVVDKPTEIRDDMRLTLTPCIKSGREVLHVENLAKRFGDKELFRGLSFDIRRGEHVALLGDNGTGKTTILKILNGLLPADAGFFRTGTNVHIGYYDQEHHVLNAANTVFEEISDAYPTMTNTQIRNLLASFLFTGEDVFKRIADLSGGEKGRVSLAKLMLSEANLLILDEPTNHLDITSKEILEEAVRNYEGTVIYVSHDRYFINRTATRILELNEGSFVNYIGNYDYYLEKKADPDFDEKKAVSGTAAGAAGALSKQKTAGGSSKQGAAVRPENDGGYADAAHGNSANAAAAGSSSASGNQAAQNSTNQKAEALRDYMQTEERRRERSWEEQKERRTRLQKMKNELKACESSIQKLEQRDFELDDIMSQPEIATNSAKLNELSAEKAEVTAKLEALYTKWEEVSEAIEAFENED